MKIEDWVDERTGFLNFYHKSFPIPDSKHYHGAPFADTWDSTAIWLTQKYINKTMTRLQVRRILLKGMKALAKDTGRHRYYRTLEKREEIGKDQLDFLVVLMEEVGLVDAANGLIKNYGDTWLPHRRDHLRGSNTLLGRMFESFDAVIDWYSDSQPSQMNNIARLVWKSYKGKPNKTAIKLFKKKLDPWWIMVVYGSKRPEDGAGKTRKEKKILFDKIFKKATTTGATVYDPPPVYLNYDKIFENYL